MTERSTTSIEKHFIINNVYKRSRRYFDIMKLNQLEHQQQLQRRQPQYTKDTIDTRFTQSFTCSNALLNDKVNNDLGLFHSRKVNPEEQDQIQTTVTNLTKKSKTVDMRKMLARSAFDRQKPKYRNQQQFNNFSLSVHKPRKSMDFNTYLDRSGSKTQRYDNSDSPQFSQEKKVGKVYEKILFDQSHNKCYVDYVKNGKMTGRPFKDQSPIYDLDKIRRGQNLTQKQSNHLLEFYQGHGKAQPSQLDNRILKDNEYQWRNIAQQRSRLKDFSVEKKKQDQILKRLNKILERKQLPDDKNQMCDEKYFRRNPNI